MRIALLGRTNTLLRTGDELVSKGHEVVLVATGRPSPEDPCSILDYQTAAERWGAEFLDRGRLGLLEEALERCDCDIGISVNYPVVLPDQITSRPRLGILNAHGGDLPRYKGNACQAWAILNGEERIGLCIHRMVAGEVDSGDILSRRFFPIDITTRIRLVLDWMESIIPNMFLEAVTALDTDPEFVLETISTDDPRSLRCFPRRPEDGRIVWTSDAVSIVRLVNASGDPFPGAFCWLNDERVTVSAVEVVHGHPGFVAVPGQVMQVGGGGIVVATGNGVVRITAAMTASGRALPEVVKSIRERLT